VTFYGEGLVQAMAKDYVPNYKAKSMSVIAFNKPALITDGYRDLNSQLHQENLAYGVGGGRHATIIKKLCDSMKTTSVLDYGCGKGYLAKELPFPIWEYDPAIPEKSSTPRSADIVVCTDVLEHIEPDLLKFVLADIGRCIKLVGYLTIYIGPSTKCLPDGRNSHLIQRSERWWMKTLARHFILSKNSFSYKAPILTAVVGQGRKDLNG